MKKNFYVLQELHYINNVKYYIDIFNSNDYELVLNYKKVLSHKYLNCIYRIVEVLK